MHSSSSLIRTTLQSMMGMKKTKQRPKTPTKTTTAPPPFSPPPTPQNTQPIQPRSSYCNNKSISLTSSSSSSSSFKKTKRNLLTIINISETLTSAAVPEEQNHQKTLDWDWKPLNLGTSELFLPLTFPTGQTFRWKQTGLHHYTGVVASHLVSLKQLNNDVSYCIHGTSTSTTHQDKEALDALGDYLNVGISLKDMWETFSASDSRFSELAMHLGGARVLRQDPFECLIQFLCSSNNNIGRITKMVDFISSLGDYLGTVEGFKFHVFPSLERLSLVSEEELRAAGFGYRAKYIVGTVKALLLKPGGGAEWLVSLRRLDLHEAVEALSSLPGVGPKVAACVALFSLDQHHAVPVDTHVWQIATRYLIPELAGARLTPKLCSRVADAFVSKYGKYAGWAQTLLFIAELPSQKALLEMQSSLKKDGESEKLAGVEAWLKFTLHESQDYLGGGVGVLCSGSDTIIHLNCKATAHFFKLLFKPDVLNL